MKKQLANPLLTRQRGISIIELMVALLIGSILTAGVINLFISSRQAYRLQESTAELQENARFALQVMNYGIRMADHWGTLPGANVSGSPGVSGIGGCNASWILNADEGIRGYEGVGSVSPLPAGCISDDDYIENSDVLVVRYASPNGIANDADLGAGDNASTIFVRTQLGTRGELFVGSAGAPAGLPQEDGTYNYPYAIEAYFLRPCSEPSGATCTANDDSGTPIPTLYRLALDGTTLTLQPLVEGIDQLQFDYGIDLDRDEHADRYASAATIDADSDLLWTDVVSVRISAIVKTLTADGTYTTAQTFAMAGDFNYAPAVDNYRRRMYTNVVQIRNRSRF